MPCRGRKWDGIGPLLIPRDPRHMYRQPVVSFRWFKISVGILFSSGFVTSGHRIWFTNHPGDEMGGCWFKISGYWLRTGAALFCFFIRKWWLVGYNNNVCTRNVCTNHRQKMATCLWQCARRIAKRNDALKVRFLSWGSPYLKRPNLTGISEKQAAYSKT